MKNRRKQTQRASATPAASFKLSVLLMLFIESCPSCRAVCGLVTVNTVHQPQCRLGGLGWPLSVLCGNPDRLLLILTVCFTFNFSFLCHKAGGITCEEEGSKVFDSNSSQTLRGTSSAGGPVLLSRADREATEKLLKLYLKRSITLAVMTRTV